MVRSCTAPLIRIPDDLLVLFEPAEKQMDLHHRAPAIHIGIEILQVRVVRDRFVVGLVCESLGKILREGGFARPDDSRNPYEHDYMKLLAKAVGQASENSFRFRRRFGGLSRMVSEELGRAPDDPLLRRDSRALSKGSGMD